MFCYSVSTLASYEIISMDFYDHAMQEQLCIMIAEDQDVQAMTQDTAESIRNI